MNPFQKMIDDVFKCPAFREIAVVNDTLEIPVIKKMNAILILLFTVELRSYHEQLNQGEIPDIFPEVFHLTSLSLFVL